MPADLAAAPAPFALLACSRNLGLSIKLILNPSDICVAGNSGFSGDLDEEMIDALEGACGSEDASGSEGRRAERATIDC